MTVSDHSKAEVIARNAGETPKNAALQTNGRGVGRRKIVTFYDGVAGLNPQERPENKGPNRCMSGCLDTSGHTRDVAVSGQYAYVADGANGLRIIDIGTPSAPALVGELATADQHGGDACVVELMGHDYVCVGDLDATSQEFQVIRVSNPNNPVLVGKYNINGYCTDIVTDQPYAYTAATGGLRIFDVSVPSMPSLIGTYASAGRLALGANRYLYASEYKFLNILDVSDPTSPSEVCRYEKVHPLAYAIDVSGTYCCLAGRGKLEILDVSNTASPATIGEYETEADASDVLVSGSLVYIAGGEDGLEVVDISDPTWPIQVGTYDTSGQATAIVVSNGYAYVADGDGGLLILSIGP